MENKSTGITFTGLLISIFIALKLTNVIDWSWWWVLSPLWIPYAVYFILFLVISLIIGVITTIDSLRENNEEM